MNLFQVLWIMIAVTLVALPGPGEARRARKVPLIGVVNGASPSPAHPIRGLQRGLREPGYVEGQTIHVEYRWAHGNPGRIPDLVAEVVRLDVDAIVAGNTAVAVAAKHATKTIPIVMAVSSDPIERGFIASFAQPGGNVTGMASFTVELTAKQLELLRETLPGVTRVAVMWNPAYEASRAMLDSAETAASSLGLRLQILGARGAHEYEAAFAEMARGRSGRPSLLCREFS